MQGQKRSFKRRCTHVGNRIWKPQKIRKNYFTSNIPTLPGSLMVVCEVGHSRESHGSLLGLGTLGSLTVVCWDWALQGVSR